MRLCLALLMGAVLWSANARAEPTVWTVDPAQSRIGFQAEQLNAPFEGRFARYVADVAFDPDDLAASSVRVTVDVTSLDTGNSERDSTAQGADWFASTDHPKAVFESDRFVRTGKGRYEAQARLTLRDATHPVVFPFSLRIEQAGAGRIARVAGDLPISRTAFGVGQGQWAGEGTIGDQVIIQVQLLARSHP